MTLRVHSLGECLLYYSSEKPAMEPNGQQTGKKKSCLKGSFLKRVGQGHY